MKTEENINILGNFCGIRDIKDLNSDELQNKYNINQADIMVLFGGSIICGGDLFAKSIKNKIAKKYIIVGGVGHTTESLRQQVKKVMPSIKTNGLCEAEIFDQYIKERYGVKSDYLECKSTNCGNNITNLLSLMKNHDIKGKNIIICQDATMQRRMDACLHKYSDMQIINFAAYFTNVISENGKLKYSNLIPGMWSIHDYINLLMGEIPRLTDDQYGYGPKGRGFISHVDIPSEVQASFEELKKTFGEKIRPANPDFATK